MTQQSPSSGVNTQVPTLRGDQLVELVRTHREIRTALHEYGANRIEVAIDQIGDDSAVASTRVDFVIDCHRFRVTLELLHARH